jgi:hypothetical protein
MREIESLMIKYVGYKEPSTEDEVELEILGLRTAIAAAEQRVAVLTQSLKLRDMVAKSKLREGPNEKIVTETPATEEDKQQG